MDTKEFDKSKVQIKCCFFPNLEEQHNQEDSYLPFLNIPFSSRVIKGLKKSSFRSKSGQKLCRNQSK